MMANRTTQTKLTLTPTDKKRSADQAQLTNKNEPATKKAKSDGVPKTTIVKIKRKNGQVIQDCDIYIGRAINMGGWRLKGSKWANPYKVKDLKSNENAVEMYRQYLLKNEKLMKDLPELKGKVLGCWCKPAKCHGDVLIELVNKLDTEVSEKKPNQE